MFPNIGGALSVALARAFKIIDPGLKHPHSEQWDRANQPGAGIFAAAGKCVLP